MEWFSRFRFSRFHLPPVHVRIQEKNTIQTVFDAVIGRYQFKARLLSNPIGWQQLKMKFKQPTIIDSLRRSRQSTSFSFSSLPLLPYT